MIFLSSEWQGLLVSWSTPASVYLCHSCLEGRSQMYLRHVWDFLSSIYVILGIHWQPIPSRSSLPLAPLRFARFLFPSACKKSYEIGFVCVSDHQTCDIDKIGVHAVGMPETTFSLAALASLATAPAKAFFLLWLAFLIFQSGLACVPWLFRVIAAIWLELDKQRRILCHRWPACLSSI